MNTTTNTARFQVGRKISKISGTTFETFLVIDTVTKTVVASRWSESHAKMECARWNNSIG